MLTELMVEMTQKKLEELKKDPRKHEELVETIIGFTDLATELIKENPDFRKAFARIHSQFLQYPECIPVIRDALTAYRRYYDDKALSHKIDQIPPP